MEPIKINQDEYICPKCRTKVKYVETTDYFFQSTPETYGDWRIVKHKFCPECGEKIDWEKS